MVVLFALLVLMEVKTPNRYNWKERTYSHKDDNPFGAKVVDSLLSASLKNGYEVRTGSLPEAYENDSDLNSAILLVNYSFHEYGNKYRHQVVDILLEILSRGQTVIIFTDYNLGSDMYNKLNVMTESYSDNQFINSTLELRDSIRLEWKQDSCYDDTEFRFRAFDPGFSIIISSCSNDFGGEYEYEDIDGNNYVIEFNNDIEWEPLLLTGRYNNEWIAATCDYDGGKLVLVSYPLLFTNYYVLEKGGAQLLMRILSQAGNHPIIRYDATLNEEYIEEIVNNKSQSPLRVFLDHKSLRWAIYLTLIGILISLFFTARRKQRVIPLVEEPKNQTIEMIKHLGLMFYRNHDNATLISNKYRQLVFELQRKKLIYLDEDNLDEKSQQTLADLAGVDTDKFNTLLTRLKAIEDDEFDIMTISDKESKRLINMMNKMMDNM